jgi:hypothetical protein
MLLLYYLRQINYKLLVIFMLQVTIRNSLDKVSRLRGVYFTYIDTNKRSTGLIAQETEKIIPEAIADKGEYMGVASGNLVGLLVEAIKELNQKVDKHLDTC